MGVPVGFHHRWYYSGGVWAETKVSPSLWLFNYSTRKTRIPEEAPRNSGFPEGGELHWKIEADQWARKVSANAYLISMRGEKRLAGWR